MKNFRLFFILFFALNLVVIALSYKKNYDDSTYIYFDWDTFNKTLIDNHNIDIKLLTSEITNSLSSEIIKDSIINPVKHRRDWKYKHTNFLARTLDSVYQTKFDISISIKSDKSMCFEITHLILNELFENHIKEHPYNQLPKEFFQPNIDGFFIFDGIFYPGSFGLYVEELIQSSAIHQDEAVLILVLEYVLIRINENFILTN